MRLRAKDVIFNSLGQIDVGQYFVVQDERAAFELIDEGRAERCDPDRQAFDELRDSWKGCEVFCLASGPSAANASDFELVRRWSSGHSERRVIAINLTFLEGARWADVFYCGDYSFWHEPAARGSYEKAWTTSERAHLEFGVTWAPGLYGPSSGHQALDLARHFGAKKILLLGFDCRADGERQHWHAPYQNAAGEQAYPNWIIHFGLMAKRFQEQGVDVVNCTRTTALACFRREDLERELSGGLLAS